MPSPSRHTQAHQRSGESDRERSRARESADSRAQDRMRKPLPLGSGDTQRGTRQEPDGHRSGSRGEASALAGESGLGRMVRPNAQDDADAADDALDEDPQ